MRAILGITGAACLIFSFTTTVSAFVCPPIGSNETGYYPHETDCNKFYQCDNGIPVEHICPPERHFNPNPEIQACDWEWNLDPPCVNGKIDLRAPSCPPGPSDPEAEVIYHPHETDCGAYYMCDNGLAIERPCPPDQHWNQVEKVCDWPWNVKPPCVNGNLYSVPKVLPRVPICPVEPPPEGQNATLLPHETNCNLYYICEPGGVATERPCPPDQHFNPDPAVMTCDWEWNLDPPCVNSKIHSVPKVRSVPKIQLRVPSCPPGPSDPEAEVIYHPHETDCGAYYMCDNGLAIERPCPPDQHWNQVEKVCDWPWNVKPPCVNQ